MRRVMAALIVGTCGLMAIAQGPADLPVVIPVVDASPAAVGTPPATPPAVGATASTPAAADKPAPANPPAASGPALMAKWNNGLFFETTDKSFTAHVGGTVHYDAAFYTAQPSLQTFPGGTGRFADGVNLRRGRLFAEGTLYKDFDYKFEIEFANGFLANPGGNPGAAGVSNSPGPTDAWMQWKNIPLLGTLRVGNQKEPFSLEHIENYRTLPFLERSYLFDGGQATAFNNGFSPGVQLFNTWADDRVYAAGGFFKNESDLIGFGLGDGNYAATGRAGFLPVYRKDDPDNVSLWVGGAASHRDPVAGTVQVRVRNDVRNAPFPLLNLLANTGAITASSQTLYNLEAAAAYGSAWAQAEYLVNLVNDARLGAGPDLGTARFQGFYAQSGVLLTGEHRTWNPKTASWNRIVPKHNVGFADDCGCNGGLGAWEVATRYSYLDVSDKGIDGGRLRSTTLGLNWYWNPNMKVQFNYDYAQRDQAFNPLAKGIIHSFGTRAAFDF